MKFIRVKALSAALVTVLGYGCDNSTVAVPQESGIEATWLSDSIRPQDDFNGYVNANWKAETQIPADQSSWGGFSTLRQDTEIQVQQIIQDLEAAGPYSEGSEKKAVDDLYHSFMNVDLLDAKGTEPIRGLLDDVAAIKTRQDMWLEMADLSKEGIRGPFVVFIGQDANDATRYIPYIYQTGLGLPDKGYYTREGEKFAAIRSQYPVYIARMFDLAGVEDGEAKARAVYDFEVKLAAIQWERTENRKIEKTNNPYKIGDLKSLTDMIDWVAWFERFGVSGIDDLNVNQPTYISALGDLLGETDLETLKAYFQHKIIRSFAPYLSSEIAKANFDFTSGVIRGIEEQPRRWKRGVRMVSRNMGEALGHIYVEKHFPPEAKARMDRLVGGLLSEFGRSIDGLEWMSDETKQKAQEKRAKFNTKIGYPDKWRDYSELNVDAEDLVGNIRRSVQFEFDYDLAKLGQPIDRDEWGMSPQTVNAYYNSRLNEIVFPAAILQYPFFDMGADDAMNYGGIGAVIGHEIGHAFDDRGRKSNGDGNVDNWWTDEDAAAFEKRAAVLVEQYNRFSPLDGLNVNGQLTLGENIGDLTGVTIAYKAYRASLDGKELPVIDGLTGDQRFFIAFGQVWRQKMREDALRARILSDSHSPARYRVNGTLANVDAFYDAFSIKEGDGMYLAPESRVKIWD